MNYRLLATVAIVAVLSPLSQALAQEADFFLPQIADGRSQDLAIRTTFVLFNPTARSEGVGLTLTDDQGNPLVVSLPGMGEGSSFQLSLGPGETRLLETSGEGPLQTGAAVVTGSPEAGISAVFRVSSSDGRFITEAGVGSSALQTKFVLAVDTTNPFNTGVAVFNPGALESQLTFELFNTGGGVGPTSSVTIGAGSHQARYVSGIGELFPALGNFRGTMVITSSRPVTAVVLRQNLSTLTSTTLPVVAANSQLKEFLLPHIANGVYFGGAIRTTFVLFNISNSASADVQIDLTRDDGTALPVNLGGGAQSTFSRVLGPSQSVFLTTDGTGTLSSGAARVTSSAPIGVSAIFSLYDLQGGFQTEAGVAPSPASAQLTVPVDTTPGSDGGLALFNPGAFPVSITVRLLDPLGTRLDGTVVDLSPLGHRALMVGEVFPGRYLRGSLSVSSEGPVSAMTLRLNYTPLSYTTLPRAPSAFVGFAPRQALQKSTRTGVSVDAPVSLATTLSTGFFLTGRITGPVSQVTAVVARTLEGASYRGIFDSVRGEYRVAVPEGAYSLVVCYKPFTTTGLGGTPTLAYLPPDKIVVSGNRVFDVSIPATELRRVTGRLTGLGPRPVTVFLTFTRADLGAQSQGFISMEGDYAVLLPQGDYSVSLSVNAIGAYGTNQLALYNAGQLQVGAADTTADFSLPELLTLRGRVAIQGATFLPAGSSVVARDISAVSATAAGCIVAPSVSRLPTDLSGDYAGTLSANRSYDVQAEVVVAQAGILIFAPEPTRLDLTQNLFRNFSLGALPSPVEITGVVRDPGGQPVEDVLVEARGEAIAGLAGAIFTAKARTNSLGEFRLMVLPGSNYTFTWTPEP